MLIIDFISVSQAVSRPLGQCLYCIYVKVVASSTPIVISVYLYQWLLYLPLAMPAHGFGTGARQEEIASLREEQKRKEIQKVQTMIYAYAFS